MQPVAQISAWCRVWIARYRRCGESYRNLEHAEIGQSEIFDFATRKHDSGPRSGSEWEEGAGQTESPSGSQSDDSGSTGGSPTDDSGASPELIATASGSGSWCLSDQAGIQCEGSLLGYEPPAGVIVDQLSSSIFNYCGLSAGEVVCWGREEDGLTQAPSGQFEQVHVGHTMVCGVRKGGQLDCWGSDQNGQLDAPPGEFMKVVARYDRACGLDSQGGIVCWGDDTYIGAPPDGEFVDLAMTAFVACALDDQQGLVCWGDEDDHAFTEAPIGQQFRSLSADVWYLCGLDEDGFATCWGGTDHTRPVDRDPLLKTEQWRSLEVGTEHICGITTREEHQCVGFTWGD